MLNVSNVVQCKPPCTHWQQRSGLKLTDVVHAHLLANITVREPPRRCHCHDMALRSLAEKRHGASRDKRLEVSPCAAKSAGVR